MEYGKNYKNTGKIKKHPRVRKIKYVDYDELPAWIRRAKNRINKMPTKKYWKELEKFADKLNKEGVDKILFGDIEKN
jgi:hypothetical protein